jgi:hypothetical protein
LRRLHTSYDLLDAHVLTALLREHGIDAWLFDADLVRQDWFKMIAYGGYRIMVRAEDYAAARELLHEQRAGNFALTNDTREPCPRCSSDSAIEDPQPRRNVFLAMIVMLIASSFAFLLRWHPSPQQFVGVMALQIVLYATLPWLMMRYFKWRQRCTHCGHRWREPPRHSYAELARMAESAQS